MCRVPDGVPLNAWTPKESRTFDRPRYATGGSVSEKAVNAFLHEPFLPAPDTRFRLSGPAHNLSGSDTFGAQEDDSRPPLLFLGGITVPNHLIKATAVGGTDCEAVSGTHAPDLHTHQNLGNPKGTLSLSGNH